MYLYRLSFAVGPTGLSLAHFGNKRMYQAIDGKVSDGAYKWGQAFTLVSAITSTAALGFSVTGMIMSADDEPDPAELVNLPDGFGMYIMSALFTYASMATITTASMAYEVQRRRTNAAYRVIDASSDHFEPNKNHFSIGFFPRLNGATIAGTF